MKYLKLFEEFNPYTGMAFANKLKIYAEASNSTTECTPIKSVADTLVFDIFTNQPGDYKTGNKKFRVVIPSDKVNDAYVDTYEGGQKVFHCSLEAKGENDINDILMNYIEACNLYDDGTTENIVDAYKSVNSVKDIHMIISTMG